MNAAHGVNGFVHRGCFFRAGRHGFTTLSIVYHAAARKNNTVEARMTFVKLGNRVAKMAGAVASTGVSGRLDTLTGRLGKKRGRHVRT